MWIAGTCRAGPHGIWGGDRGGEGTITIGVKDGQRYRAGISPNLPILVSIRSAARAPSDPGK